MTINKIYCYTQKNVLFYSTLIARCINGFLTITQTNNAIATKKWLASMILVILNPILGYVRPSEAEIEDCGMRKLLNIKKNSKNFRLYTSIWTRSKKGGTRD